MQLSRVCSAHAAESFQGGAGADPSSRVLPQRRTLAAALPCCALAAVRPWDPRDDLGHIPRAPGHDVTQAPAAHRLKIVTRSNYSRTSWRTAILNEEDDSSNVEHRSLRVQPTVEDSAGESFSDRGGSGVAAQPDDVETADGCGCGGTLTGAELRVKLALAASSGRLDLTDCRLERLPNEVLQLTELEELQLSGNCLTELPDEICRLTALRRLGLAGNMLTRLPPGIGALSGLEGLWLHGNLIASLPQQLSNLGALRALSLAGNCLEVVPFGSLGGLTSLTDLTLAGNRLEALPPRELAPLSRLRKLALNGNRLTSGSPGELGLGSNMTGLTELMLQGNRLECVDPTIFECPALQELSLADNQLTGLPPSLAAATALSRLHLFGNRITSLTAEQLAGLPSLSSCWLEGNPLRGEAVAALVAVAGSGAMPHLKALGLDQSQVAAATAAAAGQPGGSPIQLPFNVRVGCVLGSGPGYFKLQYGPQRPSGDCVSDGPGAGRTGRSNERSAGVRSSNDLLIVAFGSAPGTPNWGGLLGKIYRMAGESRYFDVLYVADPSRDWYGGGDDSVYVYYRDRLSAYTRNYGRVLLLGDSMGATAALMFSDLASGALAFCPQVDLTAASIRPGRPGSWLARLRQRLVAAVTASTGDLRVLVGTWQHDLAQANLLPTRGASGSQRVPGASNERNVDERGHMAYKKGSGARQGVLRGVREAGVATVDEDGFHIRAVGSGSGGAGAQRKPWAWERTAESTGVSLGVEADGCGKCVQVGDLRWERQGSVYYSNSGCGGVDVKVFSVESHRLAAALDARGQLVSLVQDAILHQLGSQSRNVRVSNLL
ncbi:hypothetical protein Vretimale_19518 [Volvox reticuliferus]|uniref:Disease resistance R13L4/SHOC-2-like LRR domain-containing protein n=1 Tax=Volvox reticuliferus TaxID=1737510 RepID=A0A8J4M059_9CHLO|nr:hypothetical protein Vretifemale_19849 [Volvox reticuliferus]GIM17043.1 hypothetical protein Vretimale_19518 [Volvox reticuliferus]